MIIGISGKKQSGKNTVASIWQYLYDYYYNTYTHPITVEDFKDYIKNNHHLKSIWIQKSFAHKIKQITCILLGCTMEQLEDPIFKETPLGEEWWVIKLPSNGIIPYLGDYPPFYKKYDVIKLTPRMLMQMLGTEFGRDMVHPNIWVNATFADFANKEEWFRKETGLTRTEYLTKNGHSNEYKTLNKQFFESLPNWIISDVRFPNEVKAIKDRNGILIRVERFCYDSAEDFLVCNPDPELRKIGIQDYNINKTLSLKEITDIAKAHGYVPFSKQHESETALDNYNDWDYVIDNNGSLSELILKVKQIMFKEEIIYE